MKNPIEVFDEHDPRMAKATRSTGEYDKLFGTPEKNFMETAFESGPDLLSQPLSEINVQQPSEIVFRASYPLEKDCALR